MRAGDAPRPSPHPGAARGPGHLPHQPGRLLQSRAATPSRPHAGHRPSINDAGTDDLPAPSAPPPRPDRDHPCTFRYRVTDLGLRSALVLTRADNRFLTTVIADVDDTGPQPLNPRSSSRRSGHRDRPGRIPLVPGGVNTLEGSTRSQIASPKTSLTNNNPGGSTRSSLRRHTRVV